MKSQKNLLIVISESESIRQNWHLGTKTRPEQKIKNGLITFKISHVAAIKQYNSGEREEEKHHEICFRRP